MEAGTDNAKTGPPYMSWTTLENLFEQFDANGLPGRIDRSVLGGSEGYKTQVLAGLRWLELIDQDGRVTATLARLVKESDERQELVGALLREKYPRQVELGEKNASQRELEESFQPYGGDTARKAVSFYVKGAKFAGLPLSGYFKTPRTRKAGSSAPKRRPKPPAGTEPQTTDNADTQLEGLHPAIVGLVNDIPRQGSGWESQARRREFLETFKAVLTFAIPVKPSGGGDEDEDED